MTSEKESNQMAANVRTFAAASLSLVALFAVSSAPVPLFGIFRAQLGLTTGDVAMTAVCYFLGCIPALLFCSKLSNRFGRKPVVLAALAIGFSSALIVAGLENKVWLMVARFLQGFACGMASGSVMAWLFDAANTPRTRSAAAAVVAGGPGIGFLFGALAAAAASDCLGATAERIFTVIAAGLAAAAVFALFGRETVCTPTTTLLRAITPKIDVPKPLRGPYAVAVLGYAGTWGVGGFFQAYSAQIAADAFGRTDALTAAFIFLCFIGTNAAGGFLTGRFAPLDALRGFAVLFAVAVCTMFVALACGSAPLFFVLSVVGGVSTGAVCSAALRSATQNALPAQRAELIGAIYLAAYLGPGVPNFALGQLGDAVTVANMSVFYGIWAVVWMTLTIVGATLLDRRQRNEAKIAHEKQFDLSVYKED